MLEPKNQALPSTNDMPLQQEVASEELNNLHHSNNITTTLSKLSNSPSDTFSSTCHHSSSSNSSSSSSFTAHQEEQQQVNSSVAEENATTLFCGQEQKLVREQTNLDLTEKKQQPFTSSLSSSSELKKASTTCKNNNCEEGEVQIDNNNLSTNNSDTEKKIQCGGAEKEEDYLKTLSSRIYHLNPIINTKKQVLDNNLRKNSREEISKSSSNKNLIDSNNIESVPSSSSDKEDKITKIISSDENITTTTEMNFANSPTPHTNVPYSANAHYSLNFFNLPLEGTSIPKAWHSLLKIQASTILFTVYTGYLIQTMYVFREQSHDINATFWMFILGALTILVNSGRLIRMDKAENTSESKAIILFNVVSFSIRFFVMQNHRVLMLSNSLATIAVMSKNTGEFLSISFNS